MASPTSSSRVRVPHERAGRGGVRLLRERRVARRGGAEEARRYLGQGAEAAFSVEPGFQERGIATELMGNIIRAARNRGVHLLFMNCLAENGKMQAIARKYDAELGSNPARSWARSFRRTRTTSPCSRRRWRIASATCWRCSTSSASARTTPPPRAADMLGSCSLQPLAREAIVDRRTSSLPTQRPSG